MKNNVKLGIYGTYPLGYSPQWGGEIVVDGNLENGIVPLDPNHIGWIGGDGWAEVSQAAEFTGGTGWMYQRLGAVLQKGTEYQVNFSVSGMTGDGFEIYIGDRLLNDTVYSADGQYTVVFTPTSVFGNDMLSIRPKTGSTGTLITKEFSIGEIIYQHDPDKKEKKGKKSLSTYYPLDYIYLEDGTTFAYSWELSYIDQLNTNNGGFSKTFIVPGNHHNRKVFGYTDSDDIVLTQFDVRKKLKCDVIVDDNVFLSGWLNIQSIQNEFGHIDFECTFYDAPFALFNEINGLKLNSIDLSEFDHILTAERVLDSWSPDRVWQSGYTYPLYYIPDTNNIHTMDMFSPAFYNRCLFDRIMYDAGWTYELSPSVEERMNKLITTHEGGRRTVTDGDTTNGVRAGSSFNRSFVSPTINPFAYTVHDRDLLYTVEFENDTSTGFYDPQGLWDTSSYTYNLIAPGTPHVFEFCLVLNIKSEPSSTSTWPNSDIWHTIFDVYPNSDPAESGLKAYIVAANGDTIVSEMLWWDEIPPSGATNIMTFVLSSSTTYDTPQTGPYQLVISYQDQHLWIDTPAPISSSHRWWYNRTVTIDKTSSYISIRPETGAPLGDNSLIRMSDWLPNTNQVDFVVAQLDLFNCYVFPDGDRSVRFVSRDDLYNSSTSSSDIIKLDNKMHDVYKIERIANITSFRTTIGYAETEDLWNDTYKQYYNSQHGDLIIDNITDWYADEQVSRNKLYGSTPIITDQAGRYVPAIHAIEGPSNVRVLHQGDALYDTQPIIFQYFDPFDNGWEFTDNFHYLNIYNGAWNETVGWTGSTPHGFEVGDQIRIQQTIADATEFTYNGYWFVTVVLDEFSFITDCPWAHDTTATPGFAYLSPKTTTYRPDTHLDSITGATFDMSWDTIKGNLTGGVLNLPATNLGTQFYRDQLIQYRDGALWHVDVDLSVLDAKKLLSNVGKKIYFSDNGKNKLFHLHAIRDFDPISKDLTRLELLEVIDHQVTGFTRYFSEDPAPPMNGFVTQGQQPNYSTSPSNRTSGFGQVLVGTNNSVGSNTKDVVVVGNNNKISYGVKNTVVIGDAVNVDKSNSLYIGHNTVLGPNSSTINGVSINDGISVGTGMTITETDIIVSGVSIFEQAYKRWRHPFTAVTEYYAIQPEDDTIGCFVKMKPCTVILPVFSATTGWDYTIKDADCGASLNTIIVSARTGDLIVDFSAVRTYVRMNVAGSSLTFRNTGSPYGWFLV